jgi:hypothetical protein
VPSFEFIKNHQPQLFPNPEGKSWFSQKNWLFHGQLCDYVPTKKKIKKIEPWLPM